ncbi:hypothetical protein AQ610_05695 [Burkholderia humptydooensis]|nr:hypothetical protein AQ610_05695 [Burkholderia humptydooensis]
MALQHLVEISRLFVVFILSVIVLVSFLDRFDIFTAIRKALRVFIKALTVHNERRQICEILLPMFAGKLP